ncbi:hypothetical protein NPX13_g7968 [Xylaria arbuscula]|uniref:Aspartate/glutamate racemase family protein n=1 Tax=Xylaria arbuscula TaxID=114810 RepID=A0A9W8TKM2_9PEZI|nr:hypothetical protein NPX13_g7968 [Xylaria arbuscula]
MTDYKPGDRAGLPPIGFLAVECFFYRPPGDGFHEDTWPFPIIRELAEGSKENVLVSKGDYSEAFLKGFIDAGKKLAERGAIGIITSCGFLAQAQPILSERLPIPIATSSLLQIPSILSFLPPKKKIGIITYNGDELGPLHFERLGIPPENAKRCYIKGMPSGGALQGLVRGQIPYSYANIEVEMVNAARDLVAEHEDIAAIVLECVQMPVYADSVQKAVNLPVYDLYSMVNWFYSGLVRRRPATWGDLEGRLTGPLIERNII